MRPFAIRALLWKELRQVGRNRTALLTAALLPFVILLVAPIQLLFQFRLLGARGFPSATPLPGLDMSDPNQLLLQLIYPVLFVIGGLLLPSMTTTYAIVAERERGSLELLVSLPVSVSEILAAKLMMVLLVTALVGLPYLAIVFTLLIALGVADLTAVPALLAPFLAAVICSTAISLVLTLLARDFRSANNLNGAFIVPVLLLTVATLSIVGGPSRTYVLAAVLLVIAAIAAVAALRWVTFERYLE
jgi:ABC-type transport system involved in multi-copper enzyme maturation permease subunit